MVIFHSYVRLPEGNIVLSSFETRCRYHIMQCHAHSALKWWNLCTSVSVCTGQAISPLETAIAEDRATIHVYIDGLLVFCSMPGDEYHFSTSSNKTWLWSPHQLKTTWYLSWDLKRKHLEFIEQLLCTARPETSEMTLSQLGRPSTNDGLEDLLAHSLYPFVFFETFDPHEAL